ncbi:hypothetical protein SDC9_141942 [bioreactor metagenome]|uniref:Uncharacterized protein n=1 Tax=bioreactor metagenome TaxID=1076179 RepID=A0A645DZ39_9ZZZZ
MASEVPVAGAGARADVRRSEEVGRRASKEPLADRLSALPGRLTPRGASPLRSDGREAPAVVAVAAPVGRTCMARGPLPPTWISS